MAELSLDRIDRITGSRIPAVLGLSPHKTREGVKREMVRQHFWEEDEFQGNWVTEWGVEHEPDAIADYQLLTGADVENHGEDQITLVDADHQFAITPDGWVTDDPDGDGLVEAKCPWARQYTHWSECPDIEAQMRLQCYVTQREWCDLVVWRKVGTPISRLYYDRDAEGNKIDWLPSVMPEVEAFLADYYATIESEELSSPYREPIIDRRTDAPWVQAETEVLELLYEQERIARLVKEAKDRLAALAGNQSQKGTLVHAIRRVAASGAGSVSYKAAFEELAGRLELTPKEMALIKERHTGKGSPGGGVTWAFKKIGEKA